MRAYVRLALWALLCLLDLAIPGQQVVAVIGLAVVIGCVPVPSADGPSSPCA